MCGTHRVSGAFSTERGVHEIAAEKEELVWRIQRVADRVRFIRPAQTQPAPSPAPTLPRLKLTAQDEYVIRENLLTDKNLPRQGSATETIGDVEPQNVKLSPVPPEIVQKVPKAQGYEYFVKDDDTVILVSSSDRRVADVIKKKSSD